MSPTWTKTSLLCLLFLTFICILGTLCPLFDWWMNGGVKLGIFKSELFLLWLNWEPCILYTYQYSKNRYHCFAQKFVSHLNKDIAIRTCILRHFNHYGNNPLSIYFATPTSRNSWVKGRSCNKLNFMRSPIRKNLKKGKKKKGTCIIYTAFIRRKKHIFFLHMKSAWARPTWQISIIDLGDIYLFYLILNRTLMFNSIKYYIVCFCNILFLLNIKK